MRIRVAQEHRYRFAEPANAMIQALRVTPRSHEGQSVVSWRIDVDRDCVLDEYEDAFGNLVHVFRIEGPLTELSVAVEGIVETQDTTGIVRGTVERFPPSLYLRETPLTECTPAIAAFAEATAAEAGADTIARLHALMLGLSERLEPEAGSAEPPVGSAAAFAAGRADSRDLTHVFLAAVRHLGIPARYVSGHATATPPAVAASGALAWAEAHVERLGWVGFDIVNRLSTTEAHVRGAVGLDYLGAAPVRASAYGGLAEAEALRVDVAPTQRYGRA